MDTISDLLTTADLIAVSLFFTSWITFDFITDFTKIRKKSLSGRMAEKRKQWMSELADRELRMVDTQINSGLQQGAAFFASTSIFAIGGSFALLGATDMVLQIYRDLPLTADSSRAIWEVKVLGLVLIFTYGFFKFAWSYRLFNYCSILIGAVPSADSNNDQKTYAVDCASNMNILAGRHFTAGLRGLFFALGYMGWFVGPKVFICSTLFVLVVLMRRQYFSRAREILKNDIGRS